jgi:hypothetical protein
MWRVFVSATTTDLGSYRRETAAILMQKGIVADIQDHFGMDYRAVDQILRDHIRSCDAVICLVGFVYGQEPPDRPDGSRRLSYTQMEQQIAQELRKDVYLFLATDHCAFDSSVVEPADLTQLQEAHRQRLSGGARIYHRFESINELKELVNRIDLMVDLVRRYLQEVERASKEWMQQLSLREYFGLTIRHIEKPILRPVEQEILKGRTCKRMPVHEWLREYDEMCILGDAGTGKTTTLKELRRHYAQNALHGDEQPCIPIYFTLRGLAVAPGRDAYSIILDRLVAAVGEVGLNVEAQKISILLTDPRLRFLFLIDGLNEVPEGQSSAWLDVLDNFRRDHRLCHGQHKLVIASRIHKLDWHKARSLTGNLLEIERLSTKDAVSGFVVNYTTGWDPSDREMLIAQIWSRPASQAMAQVPGLLALMILAFHECPPPQQIPPSRPLLLQTIVEGLLGRWRLPDLKHDFPVDEKLDLASWLAFKMRTEGLEIPWAQAVKVALEAADELRRKHPDYWRNVDISAESMERRLNELCLNRVLERTHVGVYFRLHQFQEYLAALRLVQIWHEKEQQPVRHWLRPFVSEPQWHEIVSIAVGVAESQDARAAQRFVASLRRGNQLLAAMCINNMLHLSDEVVAAFASKWEKSIWRFIEIWPSVVFLAGFVLPAALAIGLFVDRWDAQDAATALIVLSLAPVRTFLAALPDWSIYILALALFALISRWLTVVILTGWRRMGTLFFERVFVDWYVQPALRALLLVGGAGTRALGNLQGELARPQVWQSQRGRTMVVNALLIVYNPFEALKDPNLRAGAILQLGEMRDVRAIPNLLEFLSSVDAQIAMLSIDALVRIAEACDVNSQEFADVATVLRSIQKNHLESWKKRRRAVQGLRILGISADEPSFIWDTLKQTLSSRRVAWLIALAVALALLIRLFGTGPTRK